MPVKEAIAMLVEGKNLSRETAKAVMMEIMEGRATDSQIAGFLIALRLKGETVSEIAGCAEVMRQKAVRIDAGGRKVIDTCGTGGDRSNTFNISTCAAIVAAGAGAVVAKHGNRSVSSLCGSADVLKSLGVNIDAPPAVIETCLQQEGIGFLFAPVLHRAMKFAIGPRRELGVRTIFNILGPLTNPAGASRQLLGVYDPALGEVIAGVLKALGSEKALVVHGAGLDELTIHAESDVWELDKREIRHYRIDPQALGLQKVDKTRLRGGDPEQNARILTAILNGERGPHRDIVLLNSAAALVAAGIADDFPDGIERSIESIDSGQAANKLQRLIALSREGKDQG